jgi:hypothetical protein
MQFLTLRKICFSIGRRFCMVEYVKNYNITYVIAMTFQLHSEFFFVEEHVYFTVGLIFIFYIPEHLF